VKLLDDRTESRDIKVQSFARRRQNSIENKIKACIRSGKTVLKKKEPLYFSSIVSKSVAIFIVLAEIFLSYLSTQQHSSGSITNIPNYATTLPCETQNANL